ncbi:MAG TPA: nucleotidyltransferase family protein [Caulobacteraceae bacterium]
MRVFATARDLDLPDWLVFSGAIYQPVWNELTGRPLEHGLKDYDLAYFDAGDLSWVAEDAVIRRVAAAFEPPLRETVEVRNQARVHLWFEDHFGEPYAPLANAAEAVVRFTATAFAVGARLEPDGRLTIVAPFGLEDLFALRLKPNPIRPSAAFTRTAEAARRRWPEVTIEP